MPDSDASNRNHPRTPGSALELLVQAAASPPMDGVCQDRPCTCSLAREPVSYDGARLLRVHWRPRSRQSDRAHAAEQACSSNTPIAWPAWRLFYGCSYRLHLSGDNSPLTLTKLESTLIAESARFLASTALLTWHPSTRHRRRYSTSSRSFSSGPASSCARRWAISDSSNVTICQCTRECTTISNRTEGRDQSTASEWRGVIRVVQAEGRNR